MAQIRTLVLATAAGLASIATLPATAMQAPPSQASARPDFPPFSKVAEGFTEVAAPEGTKGMYRLWINKKDQRVIAELPRMFEKQELFLAWTVAGGIQQSAVQTGDQYAKFKRFGKRLALVEPNYAIISTGDSESRSATGRVFTDRVITEIPILAMGPGGGPVIDMNQMFVNGARTFFGNQAAGANSRLVTVEKAKTFPTNVEIEYEMPLAGGKFGTLAYSIAEIPARSAYKPRQADDRVGYFTTSIKDLGDPSADSPWKRYINRWHLEKADPKLRLSPPKEPIVFYIEHTVPVRYRRWVRDAVLEWNKAFEEVGFDNAIVVYQQDKATGAHMEKDPEDARFNFICWTNADMGFAIGPSRAHPKTGEILDADIVMDEGFISGWVDTWNRQVPHEEVESLGTETIEWLATRPQYDPRVILAPKHEQARIAREISERHEELRNAGLRGMHPSMDGKGKLIAGAGPDGAAIESEFHACTACANCARKAFEVGFMRMNADLLGLVGPRLDADGGQTLDGVPEEFIGPLLKEVIMHEVGHTLGLRHNFKGSQLVSYEEMNSEGFDGPVSSSVMDYLPVNIAFGEDVVQGPWTCTTIGPYDMWAIAYGYTPGDTKEVLARANEPELIYATDEDTPGPDPMARRFDHAENPLDYADSQIALVQELRSRIIDDMVDDGEGWAKARRAYEMLLRKHRGAIGIASNWIGGTTVNRVKKGMDRDPIESIPADQQRRALMFVLDNSMPDDAYGLSPELLRKMTVEKWFDNGGIRDAQRDATFPIHQSIASAQNSVLTQVINPSTLNRVFDNEFRAGPDEDVMTIPEVMEKVKVSIWTELDSRPDGRRTASNPYISSLRRNIQRSHLERLVDLAGESNGFGASSTAVASISRHQLRELEEQIGETLSRDGNRLDPYTKAHLADAKSIIDRVLNSDYIYNQASSGGGGGMSFAAFFGG
ncbi:MAG: zinc-dependent metalloprotease [Planctomycetota bacterium]|nr:zinc-dependent metalloprotease [Planctomycetota bacterium]